MTYHHKNSNMLPFTFSSDLSAISVASTEGDVDPEAMSM